MTVPRLIPAFASLALALTSAQPLHASSTVIDLASERVLSICGDSADGQFAFSAAVVDLNGDGYPELAVGAPGLPGARGIAHTGGVYIFDKVAAVLVGTGEGATVHTSGAGTVVRAGEAAAALVAGLEDRGRFGESLAAGDFDGDGLGDLAVGAPAADDEGAIAAGQVAVFFGSRGRSASDMSRGGADVLMTGPKTGAKLGSALLSADLDGDGADELLAAAPGGGSGTGAGVVFVLRGSALREAAGGAALDERPVEAVAEHVIAGERPGDALGALAAGDVDGDGAVDLVLGAHHHDGHGLSLIDAGRIYVVRATQVLDGSLTSLPAGAAAIFDGNVERGFLGRSLSVADIDQDGVDDILVSLHGSSAGGERVESTGEALILFGQKSLDVASVSWGDAPRFTARARWDMFGLPLLLADIDGDGHADAVLSAQFADGPDGERNGCGEVYVFRGSLKSVMAAKAGPADRADIMVVGGSELNAIGRSLLVADVFGGGAPELLIGAPDAAGTSTDTSAGAPQGLPGQGMLIVIPDELLAR